MLHRMSMDRGWSHTDMMRMPKRLFYRYYGYMYQDSLRQKDEMDERERREKLRQKEESQPRQWK